MVLSKGFNLPISKLHSILAVANLLAHNNLGSCYYGQVKTFGGSIYFAADVTYGKNKNNCYEWEYCILEYY